VGNPTDNRYVSENESTTAAAKHYCCKFFRTASNRGANSDFLAPWPPSTSPIASLKQLQCDDVAETIKPERTRKQ